MVCIPEINSICALSAFYTLTTWTLKKQYHCALRWFLNPLQVNKSSQDATVLAPKTVVQGDVNALKLGFSVTHDALTQIALTLYVSSHTTNQANTLPALSDRLGTVPRLVELGSSIWVNLVKFVNRCTIRSTCVTSHPLFSVDKLPPSNKLSSTVYSLQFYVLVRTLQLHIIKSVSMIIYRNEHCKQIHKLNFAHQFDDKSAWLKIIGTQSLTDYRRFEQNLHWTMSLNIRRNIVWIDKRLLRLSADLNYTRLKKTICINHFYKNALSSLEFSDSNVIQLLSYISTSLILWSRVPDIIWKNTYK